MAELMQAVTLFSSSDGSTYNAITGLEICKHCGKRTLVCPHKFPKDLIIELPRDSSHLKIVRVEPDMRITMTSERNTRMTKVNDNIKFSVLESITALEDIWQEIGIKEEQKEQRNNTVVEHVEDLLKEMLAEEDELKQKMYLKTEEYKRELSELCNDLGLPPKQIPSNLSLLQLEGKLRNDVDTLNKEKHDRLKSLKRLRNDEQELCDRLVMPQHELNFVGCPTLEQLRELEQNVKFLKAEKGRRLELFKKLQASIKQLWTELDAEPVMEMEQRLCREDADDTFVLSNQNLEDMTNLQKKLEQEHSDLIQQIDGLRARVKSLYERLDTCKEEREKFLKKTASNTPKIAKMFMKEVERLEELKRQHMQKFIESIRKELVSLWDKCYFGDDQRQLFMPFYSDVFTEETLAEHEHQVTTVKNFYEDNKEMFKIVEKRESLWKKKLEFENRSTDSNRLNNRGGALLKEEKIRKAVEKELPKVESEIRKRVIVWEKENETYFMFNGHRYIDFVECQRNDYEHEQQMKKDEKHRAKQEELNQELAYGSKVNPKRKIVGTPGKQSKVARLNGTHTPSRFTHSSILPSPRRPKGVENRTPVNQTAARKVAAKNAKKGNKVQSEARRRSVKRRSMRLANAKRVLTEKSQNQTSMPDHHYLDDSKVLSGSTLVKPNPNLSLISYSDFTNAVAESPYSRSSFLCNPGKDRTPNMFSFTNISSHSSSSSSRSNRTANRTMTDRAPKHFKI